MEVEDKPCWLVLITILAFLHGTDGLTCLSCNDAVRPENCENTVVCQAHEICYMELYVTAIGSFIYHLGCRDSRQCHPGTAGRRFLNETAKRSTDSLICTDCCDKSDLCNSGGCGYPGYPSVASRGPICYNCAQQLAPGMCNKIKICGRDDVCQITRSPLSLYSSDCANEQACENSINAFRGIIVGKKRLTDEVSDNGKHCLHKCCDGDLCNGDCGTVGTIALTPIPTSGQTATQAPDPCLSNPCVHGTCSIYSNTYKCKCIANAYGRNCEHYDDPCLSNPCVHGACNTYGAGFMCQCNSGYSGTLCDNPTGQTATQAPDPCLSNPCVYGTCSIISSTMSYKCTCTANAYGRNCEHYANLCLHNPCVHGACHTNGAGFACQCYSGYSGTFCDRNTINLPESTRCNLTGLINHQLFHTTASHPLARHCPQTNDNTYSEALLLQNCQVPSSRWQSWKADIKVIDNCHKIPKGEPLGAFIGGQSPVGIYATFWECTAVSFKIFYQDCGHPPVFVEVGQDPKYKLSADTFYTLRY